MLPFSVYESVSFDKRIHQYHHQHSPDTQVSTPQGPCTFAREPFPHCPCSFPFPGTSCTWDHSVCSCPGLALSRGPTTWTFIHLVAHLGSFFLFAAECNFERTKLLSKKVIAGHNPTSNEQECLFPWIFASTGCSHSFQFLPIPQMKMSISLLPEFAFRQLPSLCFSFFKTQGKYLLLRAVFPHSLRMVLHTAF